MLKNKLLLLGALSVLFSTSIVAVETDKCVGGACFVKLDKFETSKKEDSSNFIDQELDKSATIVLDGQTITVFPKSSYTMSSQEENNYYVVEDSLLVTEGFQEEIMDKLITLPNSEYFCEKNRKPVVDPKSGFYECV